MFDEAAQIINQNLLYPLVFIATCLACYFISGAFIYYKFLTFIPEVLIKLVGFIGAFSIIFTCVNHMEWIKGFTSNWNITGIIIGFGVFFVLLCLVGITLGNNRKTKAKTSTIKKPKKAKVQINARRNSLECRSDEIILASPLQNLSGAEFERLLALYFRDHGFDVKETGVGGKDGGVDLVVTDRRGEKTAVQAKCYSANNIGVQTVRELVGAKRNHDCILSLLITTSDLTEQAKKEADQFKVDYWHGAVLERKLASWGKWQPSTKGKKKPATGLTQLQSAAASISCDCGAQMVVRKSRDGKSFWGCSTFPKCRHTKSV